MIIMHFSVFAERKYLALCACIALCAIVLAPFAFIQAQAAPQGTITINKEIVGTTTVAANTFSFLINGGSETQFEIDGSNDVQLNVGTYTITEPAVAGYVTTYENCQNINLTASGTATCTITNTASSTAGGLDPGYLVVNKVIQGTTTVAASDFTFDLTRNVITPIETNEPFAAGGSNVYELPSGLYSVLEDNPGSLFTVTYGNSLNAHANCANLLVSPNATTTCTITNTATSTGTTTPETGTLVVKKVVNGGSNGVTSFSFLLNGGATTTFGASGEHVFSGMATGSYTVSEVPFANYTPTYSNCMNATVLVNATTTCTITNTFNVGGGQLYEITGIKWNDEDGDGVFDNNENPLSGWTIRAEQTGETPRVDVTDTNGRYTLLVTSGDWTVSEIQQSGWNITYPQNGTHTVTATGTATSTILVGDYNFGNQVDADSSGGGGGGGGGNGVHIELRNTGNDDDDDDDNGSSGGGRTDGNNGSGGGTTTPPPLVLGDQTTIYPYGAPNTGVGGMFNAQERMDGAATLPLLSMILVMLVGFGIARAMRDPHFDEEERV